MLVTNMQASKLVIGVALACVMAAAAPTNAFAQETTAAPAQAAVVVDNDRYDDRDDGFDWGLLGLLGLLGLMPRKRTEVVVNRDDVNRNPNIPR